MSTSLYHITHVNNLPAIMAAGGLHCVASLGGTADGMYLNIAHGHIQDRRARKTVPCGPGGTLHDYVPFYFAPRSPMLYVLRQGGVVGYAGGQVPIVHLVVEVEQVMQAGLSFVFTDGHAVIDISQFYMNLADLDKVDWAIMKERYWNDTNTDGDRKRRRQAEFLVHEFVPWNLVTEIGVANQAAAKVVAELLGPGIQVPVVSVQPGWYY